MNHNLEAFYFSGIAAIFLLSGVIVYVVVAYRRRQRQHAHELAVWEARREEAIVRSQLEMAEKTMTDIGAEIHDGIKNRLGLAIRYLDADPVQKPELIGLLHEIISEMSNLSRSLKGHWLVTHGLEAALENEARIISTSGAMKCTFSAEGEVSGLSVDEETILFRCAQEAMHNAVKHSGGKAMSVSSTSEQNLVTIIIRDNGQGIKTGVKEGMGLRNIRKRMELLGGECLRRNSTEGGYEMILRNKIPQPQT